MENQDFKPPPKPFRFCRPWETPPRNEDDEEDIKPDLVRLQNSLHDNWDKGQPSVPIKQEKKEIEEDLSEEEVEVFSFDRERLVLRSEKVRVKRDSTSSDVNINNNNCKSSSSSSSCVPSSHSSPSGEIEEKENRDDLKPHDIKVGLNIKEEDDGVGEKFLSKRKSPNNSDSDDNDIDDSDEDDYDTESEEEEGDSRILAHDFPDGRNKERKNSKWADYGITRKSSRLKSKTKFCSKAHKSQMLKKLTSVLRKDPSQLTEEDRVSLAAFPELVKEASNRLEKRRLATERMKEEEDPKDVLEKKCTKLAQVIMKAKYLVVYTGAGISTSASIPDYRGPNGIWTLMKKGQPIQDGILKQFPCQSADPTLTHMAIKELYQKGIVKHTVSQNVDGLHLRSGIPKVALSEVHGNMYIEVCIDCHREYVRLFDVTENTRRHHHKTGRYCYHCGSALRDSVVLFGEKGSLRWPINWAGAEYNVDKADVILCLGSSLKVLRRYPWLWSMSKPAKQRPKLYIVNLQWTPKDRFATLKINGRCDQVVTKVMEHLNLSVPAYAREQDPIFTIATPLHNSELESKLYNDLSFPEDFPYPEKSTDLQNYFRFEPVFSKEVRALNQVKRRIVDGENEDKEDGGKAKASASGIIGWLGNALSVKPKKKKVKY